MTRSFLVFSGIDFPQEYDSEYLDYVRKDHIPQLLSVPGITNSRCFRLVYPDKANYADGTSSRHIILSDAIRPDVVESKEYKGLTPWRPKTQIESKSQLAVYENIFGLKHTQYTGMSYKCIWIAGFDIPPELEAEFNRLYNIEHIPPLLERARWDATKRYRLINGLRQKYLAIHEMESPDVWTESVLDRPTSRHTEWHRKISPKLQNGSRNTYELLYGLALY